MGEVCRPEARRSTGDPFPVPVRAALLGLVVGVTGLVACEGGSTTVAGLDEGRIEDLVVHLAVAPDTLRAGDTLHAVATLRNPSDAPVTVDVVDGCPAGLETVDSNPDEERDLRLHVPGRCETWITDSGWAEPPQASSYTIQAGDSLVVRWMVRAWRWFPDLTPPDSQAPYPSDDYLVRITPHHPALPVLEAPFEILDSGYYWNMMSCGSFEPNLEDTLVVEVEAPEAVIGLYNHPFRIYNHSGSDIRLERIGDYIGTTTEKLTQEGVWEHHFTSFDPHGWQRDFVLPSGECIQTWNTVATEHTGGPGPPGTYRMVLEYGFETRYGHFVYSGPLVIPEG